MMFQNRRLKPTVRRSALAVVAGVLVAGTLAACGSGSSDGDGDGPIVIGGISDITGGLAPLGVAQKQMGELAVEKLNADGGLLGRKVEIKFLDGETSPEKWALQAKRLLDRPMVVGGLTGAERTAVKDIITARTMFVTPGYTEDASQNCIDMMFGAGAVPEQFIIPLVDFLVEEADGKTVYMLGSDYDYPQGVNRVAKKRFEELGLSIIGDDYFPLDATSFATAVRKIESKKPAIVFSNVIPPTSYTLLKQLHEAGVWGSFVFGTPGSDEGWIAGAKEMANGVYGSMDYFDTVDDAMSTEIRDAYYAKFGKKYPISSAGSATGMYRGIMLWADAVKRAKSTDPKKVAKEMDSAKADYAPGGPAEIAPGTHNAKLQSYIGQLDTSGVKIVKTVAPVDPPTCK